MSYLDLSYGLASELMKSTDLIYRNFDDTDSSQLRNTNWSWYEWSSKPNAEFFESQAPVNNSSYYSWTVGMSIISVCCEGVVAKQGAWEALHDDPNHCCEKTRTPLNDSTFISENLVLHQDSIPQLGYFRYSLLFVREECTDIVRRIELIILILSAFMKQLMILYYSQAFSAFLKVEERLIANHSWAFIQKHIDMNKMS